jgi:hypothetical protein
MAAKWTDIQKSCLQHGALENTGFPLRRHALSFFFSGASSFKGRTVMLSLNNTERKIDKQGESAMTEKKNSSALGAKIDPGYVMVLVYVLSVTVLVLFGWFGAAGAQSGTSDTRPIETAAVLQSFSAAQR